MSRNILLLGSLAGCADAADTETGGDPTALGSPVLRWGPGYPGEQWAQAREGVLWSLSPLGEVDPEALEVLDTGEEVVFRIDLSRSGLSDAARRPLDDAWEELEQSGERDERGAVDVGRFLMRTVYEPWRYYEATGACATLQGWRAAHPRVGDGDALVSQSRLVEGDRELRYDPAVDAVHDVAWSVSDVEHGEVVETHVFDVSDSGALRFAQYDEAGVLIPSGVAGQPGRCQWCHEGNLIFVYEQPEAEGYGSFEDLEQAIFAQQALLDTRAELHHDLDWGNSPEVHVWAERLVESFLHPPPARVSWEWGVDVGEVEALGLATHIEDEYGDTGLVYTREDVDDAWEARGGFAPVRTLPSSRELDGSEELAGEAEALERLSSCLSE